LGSEFAVGWNWALSLARAGHDVVVLTRSQSRPAIERALGEGSANPRFAYFDVPKGLRWQRRGPLHVHSILWQWLVLDFAAALNRREEFDRVHHVTYAGLRAPSFMGELGIPFIFGPVGGGERAPWHLRKGFGSAAMVLELVRDTANLAIRVLPFMSSTFARADRIYVTSPDTLRLMPSRYRRKTTIELAIGIEESRRERVARSCPAGEHGGLRVLYAGRFVDWKGMHLGLPAFAQLAKADPLARLTMVGDGPAKRRWYKLAQSLGIGRQVEWLPWQPGEAMEAIYEQHHVLLFPSLHDSGGLVALEAMRRGLPVVCLKLGGPAALVNDECGRIIDSDGKCISEVVAELGEALLLLDHNVVWRKLSSGACARSREFLWDYKVVRLYGSAA
jgi:glycosyltransferase involved in cell wall biosynthesis